MSDLGQYAAVLGFGVGVVFGFTFDTAGPGPRPLRAAQARGGHSGRRRGASSYGGRPTAREEREAAAEDDGRVDRDLERERERRA